MAKGKPNRSAATAAEKARLSLGGKAYVCVVVGGGTLATTLSVAEFVSGDVPAYWIILAAVTLLGGLFAIKIPSLHATLSVFDGLLLALLLLCGPAAAIVTVALDGLLASVRIRHQTVYRTVFNIAEPAVTVWCATTVFYALSGVSPLLGQAVQLDTLFLPLVALAATYVGLNTLLTAMAIRLETGMSSAEFLRQNLPHLFLNYVINLCLLVFIVQHAENIQNAGVWAFDFVLALLILSYVVSKNCISRIESAVRQLTAPLSL